jgi:hypothetical protein
MFELHQTKIAVFGGNPSQPIQYKGTSLPDTTGRVDAHVRFRRRGWEPGARMV